MAVVTRAQFRGRGPAVSRKMFWVRKIGTTSTGSLGTVQDQFSSFRANMGILMNPPGLTVIRWILDFNFRAVAVDDTIVRNLIGIVVAPIDDQPPANALTSEFQRDWVLWSHQAYVQERQEGTPTHKLMHRRSWDIRTARKLEDPERTPYVLVESQDSDTQDYSFSMSMLVKLP